ncbi:MAG: TIGR00268 family protein, partial [Candidatus Latescibacterota bacterium]
MTIKPEKQPTDPDRLTGVARGAFEQLKTAIERHRSMVVAFSGGVDSGLLAFAGHLILGSENMLCAVGMSPSFPQREKEAAIAFLDRYDIPFQAVDTNEIENESYRKNNPDRCYHCKTELFERITDLAVRRGYAVVAYGSNLDDGDDYRPGAAAAEEQHVVAPLV